MAAVRYLLIVLFNLIFMLHASHFRGGTITWRPWNNSASGSTIDVQIRQRYSWRRSASGCACDATIIAARGYIGDVWTVICVSGSCGVWSNPIDTSTHCTDFNSALDVSSGEKYDRILLPINAQLSIAFESCCWFADLTIGAGGWWEVVSRINTFLRPDGRLNSSPVAISLPIIYKQVNIQHVHVIQMSDFDGTDTLMCRWSTNGSNFNGYDECLDVCSGLAGATLIQSNCTIVFTMTVPNYYSAVALQIEDYYSSSSTTPMSSIALQFLFYAYPAPTGSCTIPPEIIGSRPNRACLGTPIGIPVTEEVIVQVYCAGKSIVDFITSSPVGMSKSAITNPSLNIFKLTLSWVPTADQYGPQGFCAGAIDNTNLQSNQWCITFLVGFDSPEVIRPQVVQGSASPIGTIFQNHTIFSIQTSKPVGRPTRNGTYIYFWDSTNNNTLVRKFDCGWEPQVTYTGNTTVIDFGTAPWLPGHFYYVTFDSGVASGTEFCGPESAPRTDPTFWVFNIWNPAVSSTTTTTTTPPTTATATTRPTSTTSINTLLTTTGLIATSTPQPTTTTTTSTTSVTMTTTTAAPGLTTTAATTQSTVAVLYPKDLEDICKVTTGVFTAAIMLVMAPLHGLAMYTAFIKFSNMFDPARMNAKQRHQQRMKKVIRPRTNRVAV